jgi:hypothetical protein
VGLVAFRDVSILYDSAENRANCVFGRSASANAARAVCFRQMCPMLAPLDIVQSLITRAALETLYGQFSQHAQSDELD